jgi:hypothetical protein
MQQHEPSLPPPSSSAVQASTSQVLEGLSTINLREMFAARPLAAEEFLRRYYDEFSKAFPNETERPLRERLQTRLCDSSSPLQIVSVVIGDQIVGGRHFKAFDDSRIPFAAGEFLWVAEQYRNYKLGSYIISLTEEIVKQKGIPFFIGEFHDPVLCSEQDRTLDQQAGMTPEGRLAFWAKRGYQQFDAPYLCPPVFGSIEWVQNSTLGFKNLSEVDSMTSISTERYLSMLHNYWNSFSRGYQLSQLYLDFMGQFEGVDEIQIIPLHASRSFRQAIVQ